jgi:hypothetical protein
MPSTREQQLHARLLALQARIAAQRGELAQAAAPWSRTLVWAERLAMLRHLLLPAMVPALWLLRRWWRR